jgi:hypothetical protein
MPESEQQPDISISLLSSNGGAVSEFVVGLPIRPI